MADLRDFLQSMSNSAASNVSAPVDGINWLLRKAGMPVSDAPFMGSDWMAQKGLTRPVQQGAASILGETAGMLAPMAVAAKAPQIARGLLQAEANAMAPRTLNPQTGAIVWHGSPHKFDKFDSTKIGTGEGAQAYGHGLYLAESPQVASSYRESLTNLHGTPTTIDGAGKSVPIPLWAAKEIEQKGLDPVINDWASRAAKERAAMSKSLQPWIHESNVQRFEQQLADLKAIKDAGGGKVAEAGSLYKVDLPDEHIAKMLDWDKPLSQQHPVVQKALNGIETNFPEIPDFNLRKWMDADPLASTWHNVLQRDLGADPAMITGTLKDRGIPGIRYLDGGSRGAGQGSSNFVVFPGNEDILKIMERNGQGLLGN